MTLRLALLIACTTTGCATSLLGRGATVSMLTDPSQSADFREPVDAREAELKQLIADGAVAFELHQTRWQGIYGIAEGELEELELIGGWRFTEALAGKPRWNGSTTWQGERMNAAARDALVGKLPTSLQPAIDAHLEKAGSAWGSLERDEERATLEHLLVKEVDAIDARAYVPPVAMD